MHTVILSKIPLEAPMSDASLTQDHLLGLCFQSQEPTVATELKFGVVLPHLCREFQGRARSGYSSFPLVASKDFNLHLEPPAIKKEDLNLPLLALSPVI